MGLTSRATGKPQLLLRGLARELQACKFPTPSPLPGTAPEHCHTLLSSSK